MKQVEGLQTVVALCIPAVLLAATGLNAQNEYPADPDAIWTTSCQRDVERAIRSGRPEIDRVDYESDSLRERQESRSETSIWGNGEVSTKSGREPFVFRCVYDEQKRALTTVDYNFQRPASGSAASREDADHGAPWTAACKHTIHQKVREQHPKAQSIRIDDATMKQWEESEQQIDVSGGGQFVGAAGKENRFIFRCSYDTRSHQITSSNWQTRD